jgi:hypothetical protein
MALLTVEVDPNGFEPNWVNADEASPEQLASAFPQFEPFTKISEDPDSYYGRRINVEGPKGKFCITADVVHDEAGEVIVNELEIFSDDQQVNELVDTLLGEESQDELVIFIDEGHFDEYGEDEGTGWSNLPVYKVPSNLVPDQTDNEGTDRLKDYVKTMHLAPVGVARVYFGHEIGPVIETPEFSGAVTLYPSL